MLRKSFEHKVDISETISMKFTVCDRGLCTSTWRRVQNSHSLLILPLHHPRKPTVEKDDDTAFYFTLTYSLELLKVCITGHIYHVSIPHRSSCILTVQQFFLIEYIMEYFSTRTQWRNIIQIILWIHCGCRWKFIQHSIDSPWHVVDFL